ncbi:MAG: hypothetical protein M3Y28_04485 [Armatimonadota bacterium]|nr:hypothetical protein [Armatimonadota bacterium]
MTDHRGPFAEGKKGWVFWEVFWRTAALGLQYGTIFGVFSGALIGLIFALLSGVLVGALYGAFYGAILGLVLGLPLGLVLAGVTCVWFYPLTNAVLYRRVVGVIGVVFCCGAYWAVFSLILARSDAFFKWSVLAAICLAAVAAWLASRRLANWYVSVMSTDTIAEILWNNGDSCSRPQENAAAGENGRTMGRFEGKMD